jgi:hypothetical protein
MAQMPTPPPMETPPPMPTVPPLSMSGAPAAAPTVQKGVMGALPAPSGLSGKISYHFEQNPNPSPDLASNYKRINDSMTQAIWYYENYTDLKGKRLVIYNSAVPTADANFQGPIRFGGSISTRVAMHEMMHTFGVGTTDEWEKLMVNGIFTGKHATQQLRVIQGDPDAVVHGDHQHFWPYGLNYDTEVKSEKDLVRHCLMVEAITKDLKEVK